MMELPISPSRMGETIHFPLIVVNVWVTKPSLKQLSLNIFALSASQCLALTGFAVGATMSLQVYLRTRIGKVANSVMAEQVGIKIEAQGHKKLLHSEKLLAALAIYR